MVFRRGFTLIEMVAAMAVAAILLAGATSFVAFYARWTTVQRQRAEATTAIMLALERMHQELSHAKAIREKSPTAVEFEHPDITGDGVDDVIRWEWSGVAGSPLLRTVNPNRGSATPEPASPPLAQVVLEYWVKTEVRPVEVLDVRSEETREYLVLVLAKARDSIGSSGREFRRAVFLTTPPDVTGL